MVKGTVIPLLIPIAPLLLGSATAAAEGVIPLWVGGERIEVEVADTPELRRRGLMHRLELPEGQGMLLVYPESRQIALWMKDTPIPLSAAFVDEWGRIIAIVRMSSLNETIHRSPAPAKYALEMSAGWFDVKGISEGDHIEGLPGE